LEGVYYDFFDQPKILSLKDAFLVGENNDGIYSINPGKLAFYFYHECEIWLCKSSTTEFNVSKLS
jgi:hypothetical protein